MEAQPLVPMTIGQILDRTFKLYRQSFIRFITIAAVVAVPVFLLQMVLQQAIQTRAAAPTVEEAQGVTGIAIGGSLVLVFFTLVATMLCNGALAKSVSEAYLGKDVSVGQAYRVVLPKLGTLILAAILVGLLVMIGFLMLIIPGIIFFLWYSLTAQAVVLENCSATGGMSRSKALLKGNLGKVFAVGFLVNIISAIVGGVFGAIGGLIGGGMQNPQSVLILTGAFQVVGQVLATPISAAAFILLYYDMRIRKEGFDLEMLAGSMGAEVAEAAEAERDEQPPAP